MPPQLSPSPRPIHGVPLHELPVLTSSVTLHCPSSVRAGLHRSGTDGTDMPSRLSVCAGLPDSPVDMGEEFSAQRLVRLRVSIRQTDNIHNRTASSELYSDAESCSSAVSAVSRAGVAWRQRSHERRLKSPGKQSRHRLPPL